MHAADEKPIEVLNKLIGVNNNRIECYHFANREINASVLKVLFSRLVETSLSCREELVKEVYKLGGKPLEGTMATESFMQAWLEVQSAVTRQDHLGILNSFCFEEGVVIKSYEDVLTREEEHLNSLQQRLFYNQYEILKSDAEKVKNLRDAVKAG